MPTFYSDIKRYNLNKAFLQRIARKVIHYLGWEIKSENGNNIVTQISNVQNLSSIECAVRIYRGYLTLNCETDSRLSPFNYFDALPVVKQFMHTLDKYLESIPKDQLKSEKETIGHYE